MALSVTIVLFALLVAYLARPFFKGIWRGYNQDKRDTNEEGLRPSPSAPSRKTYTLKASPRTAMEKGSEKDFSYEDEYRAATARQRVWIEYEDKSGNVTERNIEIYHPEDDEYVFAWCCSRQEPRTFSRWNIRSWRLLPEHFEQDPIVERYWREEGTRAQQDRVPWRRWIAGLGSEVAARYNLREHSSTHDLVPIANRQRLDTEPPNSPATETRWWELRDQALLAYSTITSSSLADYDKVIRLATDSINGGASVSAQARLYRVLGEIYQHCGRTKEAVENLERAIRLDPGIGVKKLLARLKTELPT
jgi:hypothetical protein